MQESGKFASILKSEELDQVGHVDDLRRAESIPERGHGTCRGMLMLRKSRATTVKYGYEKDRAFTTRQKEPFGPL
ncbi:MAG: hypothetical protein V7661_06060, partial [Sulfitobacter sp.]